MARPQKQTVDYFPHDAYASAGDTLTVLESRFGNNGYAFWFKLLERLAAADGHYIDCRNIQKWQTILAKAHVDDTTGEAIMVLLLEMEAIDKELWKSRVIWCQHLVENLADVYKNRRRPLPEKPVTTPYNSITTPSNPKQEGLLPIETPQSKVKYSKVNNSKKNIYGEFGNVLLSEGEYKKLAERFGEEWTKHYIEQLSGYMQQSKKNEKKYTDHYATLRNWLLRDGKTDGTHQGNTGKPKLTRTEQLQASVGRKLDR